MTLPVRQPAPWAALQPKGVTIDGLGVLLPRGTSLDESLSVAITGTDTISEVPVTRWNNLALPAAPEAMETRRRHGGYVLNAQCFANSAFGVSTAEAGAMDPQQRLLFERGYEALHAGQLDRTALNDSLTGVFVGVTFLAFEEELHCSPAGSTVYAATGSALSVCSGRLSLTF